MRLNGTLIMDLDIAFQPRSKLSIPFFGVLVFRQNDVMGMLCIPFYDRKVC